MVEDCYKAIDGIIPDGLKLNERTTWGRSPAVPPAHRIPQSYLRGNCRVDVSLSPDYLDDQLIGPSTTWMVWSMRRLELYCRSRGTGGFVWFDHLILRAEYHDGGGAGGVLGSGTGEAAEDAEKRPSLTTSLTKRDDSNITTTLMNDPTPTPEIMCNPEAEHVVDFPRDCQMLINELPNDGLSIDDHRPTWGQGARIPFVHRTPRSYSRRTCKLKIGLTPFWARRQFHGPITALARSWMTRVGVLCRNKGGVLIWGKLRFSLVYNQDGV